MRMAMMAITTNSSMSVNAERRRSMVENLEKRGNENGSANRTQVRQKTARTRRPASDVAPDEGGRGPERSTRARGQTASVGREQSVRGHRRTGPWTDREPGTVLP